MEWQDLGVAGYFPWRHQSLTILATDSSGLILKTRSDIIIFSFFLYLTQLYGLPGPEYFLAGGGCALDLLGFSSTVHPFGIYLQT